MARAVGEGGEWEKGAQCSVIREMLVNSIEYGSGAQSGKRVAPSGTPGLRKRPQKPTFAFSCKATLNWQLSRTAAGCARHTPAVPLLGDVVCHRNQTVIERAQGREVGLASSLTLLAGDACCSQGNCWSVLCLVGVTSVGDAIIVIGMELETGRSEC